MCVLISFYVLTFVADVPAPGTRSSARLRNQPPDAQPGTSKDTAAPQEAVPGTSGEPRRYIFLYATSFLLNVKFYTFLVFLVE
jgi:hypothetical protein